MATSADVQVTVRTRMRGMKRAKFEIALFLRLTPLLGPERAARFAQAAFERVRAEAQVENGPWVRIQPGR